MSLSEELVRVGQMLASASTAQWGAFLMTEEVLDEIESSSDADLQACARDLHAKFKAWKQPQQVREAGELFELYGEALALVELKRRAAARGLIVTRLDPRRRAAKGLKTPDIQCVSPDGTFFIEVKVLDMAGGHSSANELLRQAFENEVELESRLKPGVNFGNPLEIAPHGRGKLDHSELLDNYVRRIGSNIKKEQVTLGPTFLLVVDLRIPLDCFEPTCLVPVYFHEKAYPQPNSKGECVSGDWWQIRFGRTNDLILGQSEFEGKGNLKGRQRANGILVDHPYLFGLTVLAGQLSSPECRIHTLAQTERGTLPDSASFQGMDPNDAASFFSDARNDARNTHGWKYQSRA
jgi:hypothetical protein